MLADLESVRARRPIAARRPSAGLRVRRFAQRHPTATAASAVAVVLLVIGALLYALAEGRARQRADLLTARARAEAYVAALQAAGYALMAQNASPSNARERLHACPEEHRGWEWRHLALRADEATAHIHTGSALRNGRFSPDGKKLVLSAMDRLTVVDVPSTSVVRALDGLSNANGSLALGAKVIAHGDGDGGVVVRGWPDLGVRSTLRAAEVHARPVTVLQFSADERTLFSGGGEGNVVRWDLTTLQPTLLHGHTDVVRALSTSPDGTRLVSGSIDRRVVCFDLTKNAIAWERKHDGWVLDVVFHPSGEAIFSCDSRTLRSWTTSDGALRQSLARNFDQLAFSTDGQHLVALFNRTRLALLEVRQGLRLADLAMITADDTTHDLAFEPGSSRFVSIGEAGNAQFWDPVRHSGARRVFGHTRAALAVAVLDHASAVTADAGGNLRALDLNAGTSRAIARSHSERVCGLSAATDGRFLSASERGEVWLWDAATETVQREFDAGGADLSAVALAPHGRHVLAATVEGELLQWRAADGVLVRRWRGHAALITALAFHPDGERFAAGDEAGELIEWDVATAAADAHVRRRWPALHDAWISAVTFARDGSWFAAAAADRSIRVHTGDGTAPPRVLTGHSRTPSALAATADGRLISAGGFEFEVRVWDVTNGRTLLTLPVSNAVLALASGAGTERVVSGHLSGYVQVLDTHPTVRAPTDGGGEVRLDDLTPAPSAARRSRHR